MCLESISHGSAGLCSSPSFTHLDEHIIFFAYPHLSLFVYKPSVFESTANEFLICLIKPMLQEMLSIEFSSKKSYLEDYFVSKILKNYI